MKVGFIGLGTMGSSMAYNAIQGGHELVVHDINKNGGHTPTLRLELHGWILPGRWRRGLK